MTRIMGTMKGIPMPQRPAQPIPTIQPTTKADTFSSSTADKSGFGDMLGDVTYEMVSLEEPVPGLLHAGLRRQEFLLRRSH